MSLRLTFASAVAVALAISPALAQQPEPAKPKSDLDAFMERALERRDVDRKVLNDYILDEKEEFEILGPGRVRLHRTSREYTWFVQDGIHVRSPLRFEGVPVPDSDRRAYEERWLRREKERRERKAEEENEKRKREMTVGGSGVPADLGGTSVPTEPRFVSEAYFMDFKFEPGNYYLAGREQLEGQEVVKIEYYPTKLFGGEDDEKTPRELRRQRTGESGRQLEQDIERKMNQTSLITLWVDPDTHQIVKYTFDNVWLDFLPAAWLVRVDAMRASMTMFQPFEGVWLPRRIDISAGITLANGSFSATYTRAFYDYREADVQTRIKIPKQGDSPLKGTVPLFEGHGPWVPVTDDTEGVAAQGTVPVVREVRVHGNAAVPGDEVLRIAGVQVGMPLAPDAIAAIERRLKDSGRFETVDVRMRYRSLSDPTDVALVLVVHEKTGVTVGADGRIERPLGRRIASRIMFLPVLSYADGYGFTYGARFSTVDLLGAGERLSVPLTWGGTRRAALEAERTFSRSPFTRILGSAAIWQRENPRHEIDDRRIELKGRVERSVAETLYAGLEATRADVAFGAIDDQLWTIGADAAIDTRGNPAFPANAVYLGAGWTSLHVDSAPDRINRYTLDGRGYLRVFRQSVLAGRVRYTTADAPLPIYERWLIGGSDTLRGFRAGSFEGDKALVTSAELRVPITSVLNGSRVGINIFIDAAKTAPYGLHLDDAEWERGAGAGLFLIASIVRLNLDVARSVDGGGTRVHFSTGFGF